MTSKRNVHLPSRTPAYVDRETGAAELCVSSTTWDEWVKAGVLPPPTVWLGRSRNKPLWRWKDVDAFLAGRNLEGETTPLERIEQEAKKEPFFRELPHEQAAKRKRSPTKGRAPSHKAERENVFLLPVEQGH
jgi:hypothetical protein